MSNDGEDEKVLEEALEYYLESKGMVLPDQGAIKEPDELEEMEDDDENVSKEDFGGWNPVNGRRPSTLMEAVMEDD